MSKYWYFWKITQNLENVLKGICVSWGMSGISASQGVKNGGVLWSASKVESTTNPSGPSRPNTFWGTDRVVFKGLKCLSTFSVGIWISTTKILLCCFAFVACDGVHDRFEVSWRLQECLTEERDLPTELRTFCCIRHVPEMRGVRLDDALWYHLLGSHNFFVAKEAKSDEKKSPGLLYP